MGIWSDDLIHRISRKYIILLTKKSKRLRLGWDDNVYYHVTFNHMSVNHNVSAFALKDVGVENVLQPYLLSDVILFELMEKSSKF